MIFTHLWYFVNGNFSNKVICTFAMPVMTRKIVDLQDEILVKIDEKFNDFRITIIAEIREQIKQEVSEALKKKLRKVKNWNPLSVCFRNMWKLSETSEWYDGKPRWIRTV